jgi:hypothetical protein
MVDIPANTTTLRHAAKSIVTALILGLLSPFLHLPEANAAPAALSEFSSLIDQPSGLVLKAGSSGGDAEAAKAAPAQEACESKGNRWDPQTARCIKILKKSPVTSGGAGGGSEAQSACESKGHQWNFQTGRCIKKLKKVSPVTSGGVGGGGALWRS